MLSIVWMEHAKRVTGNSNAALLVTSEVADIKRQDIRDAVRNHHGDQPRIMRLPPGDFPLLNQLSLRFVNSGRVRQERKEVLKLPQSYRGFGKGKSKTVAG